MDEKKKALERVRLLLRKADGNSNEEEARTSAHIAVKLILKHGLEISVPDDAASAGFVMDLEEIFRQARERAASQRPAQPAPKPKPRPHRHPVEAYDDSFYSDDTPFFRTEPAPPPPKGKTRGIHYEVNPSARSRQCAYCGRPFGFSDTVFRAQPANICIHKECATAYEASHG